MNPVQLKGSQALSGFRADALLENIRKTAPALQLGSLVTEYVYFIEADCNLSKDTLEKTCALLSVTGTFEFSGGFLVTPRKGTISPWSSKATDIFRNCGLDEVKRVERGIHYILKNQQGRILTPADAKDVLKLLHDRMTEGVYTDMSDMFRHMEPSSYVTVDIMRGGIAALKASNIAMGLALSDEEMEYLYTSYTAIKRNPTDVELVMFGQVNSEHCRHKIFNADWIIDGDMQEMSLFDMIRNTHKKNPGGTLVAYKDNSGVLEGEDDFWFEVRRDGSNSYEYRESIIDMIMKVETHNHPTAISPFPGAATGAGGEIRDEAATGTGSKSKAGLCGFMVSDLRVPEFMMPWEKDYAGFPFRLATPFEIMLEGPIGGAGYGNEFGRPQLLGLFRTYEEMFLGKYRGYHKPIMLAGGMGNIKRIHAFKKKITPGTHIVQLGGPAMKIGLGGGAASSMDTGSNAADLDFNSVQRGNAEMERRCQEVIDACIALGKENPIVSIHDIGAGGLSNGCPELVADVGAEFWLRRIHNEDTSMTPMEIWCCEAQERYVLGIPPESLQLFLSLCERERCPVAVLGQATGDGHLTLHDEHFDNNPIDIDLGVILGKPPRMVRKAAALNEAMPELDLDGIDFVDAVERVLHLPAVASKMFLITIADRSVTGMVARDQLTGPWQTPVADCAVTVTSHKSTRGEAMAMGERTPVALVSAPASGRMAIGEAITNIASASIGEIGNIKLSANWMCACGEQGEDAGLYETVRTVGMELCPALGISIPVGKDSLSMRTLWKTPDGGDCKMIAPMSLIISAFSRVKDVRKTVTPDLKFGDSSLILIDLGEKRNRLGCSALAQVYNQVGDDHPDLDNPEALVSFFKAVQELVDRDLLMAYHDRSDGGLFTCLAEMAIAGRKGININIKDLGDNDLAVLFCEELGAVLQVSSACLDDVTEVLAKHGLSGISHNIGNTDYCIAGLNIYRDDRLIYKEEITKLNRMWSELTYRMQAFRDNPECAGEEYDSLLDESDPGINFKLTFDPEYPMPSFSNKRPKIAILREQGINGHVEMAAAFERAGFEPVDVHMTDLFAGRITLDAFNGLVACGGFSYGDVLGAGSGWARSILYSSRLKEMFARFFERDDTFALGVCNGCQMMSQLKCIIPGAEDWPEFTRNRSEQFEARYVTLEVMPSPSVLFYDMEGAHLGVPVAHGEGRVDFSNTGSFEKLAKERLMVCRYIDHYGKPTERYPFNPNGSRGGLTALTTKDGRVTIMMPHPERAFRSLQLSYRPRNMFTEEEGPWLKIFQNARVFVG